MTFTPEINNYVSSLRESSTLAINTLAKKLRQDGEDITHFGFGQSPFSVPELIQNALAKNTHQKDYLPTRGLPGLCQAIADSYENLYDQKLHSDLVLVGPGSKELIFQSLYVLEGPVFVPAPSWVSYGPQLNLRGKEIVPIVTRPECGYKLSADELLEATSHYSSDEQKILILNNPSNPTGAVYTDAELKAISDVCRKKRILIISDEIYRLIDFSGRKSKGFLDFYPEGTIVTQGLSKSHAAGGYRFGYIAFPKGMENAVKALSAMISETFSAVSSPIQYAALEAYQKSAELAPTIEVYNQIHKACSLFLYKSFREMGLSCPKPEGAFYLFPDFHKYKDKLQALSIKGSADLAQYLLQHYNIALLPGSDFYYPDEHYGVRVAAVDFEGPQVYKAALKCGVENLNDEFVREQCPQLEKGQQAIRRFLKDLF